MNKEEHEWEIMDIYSRKDALADGVQIEANPKTRKEAGIKYPVFLTRKVYDKYVAVPKGFEGLHDEDTRLWDIFTMLKYYISIKTCEDFLEFTVHTLVPHNLDLAPNERRTGRDSRIITLHSTIGPMDFDDPQPAITIMIPGED